MGLPIAEADGVGLLERLLVDNRTRPGVIHNPLHQRTELSALHFMLDRMTTSIELFTTDQDRTRVLTEILRLGGAVPGTTLVGYVDRSTLEVRAVRSISTPDAVLDDDSCFTDETIRALNDTLCEVAEECVPARAWTPDRRNGITGHLLTVVCREGDAEVTPTESQFYWGWRFSNHLTSAFDGEVYAVTPQGWASLYGRLSGPVPALTTGLADPALAEAERVLTELSNALLGPGIGECLVHRTDKLISVRSAVNNPFQPGSDVVPAIWAGRTAQLSDWRDVLRPRLVAGLFERGRTVLGEPGLGKSSLVRRIADDAERGGDWATPQIRLALGADPIKRIAAETLRLADKAGLAAAREHRIAGLLGRVQSVAASGVSLGMREAEGQEPHSALTDLLVEIGRAAIARGNVVVIRLDEIQNIADERTLSQVLIALGDAITRKVEVEVPGVGRIERSLPIAVYLTGLSEFDDASGARKGATFTRRFKTTTLAPLADDDVRSALQGFVVSGWEVADDNGGVSVVRMAPGAVEAIVQLCQGEPFLFQLAGERAWYAGSGEVITREEVLRGWRGAHAEATSHVERILGRLPQRELDFLQAMAKLPPKERVLTRIAAEAGFDRPTDAGPASQRLDRVRGLIERGKPYSFRHRALEAFLTSDWPDVE